MSTNAPETMRAAVTTRHGGLDDRQFLTQAYRQLLRREPDRQGFADWMRVLRREGRGAVLAGIAEGPEFRAVSGL